MKEVDNIRDMVHMMKSQICFKARLNGMLCYFDGKDFIVENYECKAVLFRRTKRGDIIGY